MARVASYRDVLIEALSGTVADKGLVAPTTGIDVLAAVKMHNFYSLAILLGEDVIGDRVIQKIKYKYRAIDVASGF